MICEEVKCTGCGLCSIICPKKCIRLEKNEYGAYKYKIDRSKCIECGKCEKMCPQNLPDSKNAILKCYAGSANDEKERQTSSSGGIAAVLYKKMLLMGGVIVGANYENYEFALKLTQNETDIQLFKGSKYVYCRSEYMYMAVKEKIGNGIPVLFVGLPCQVAAIKSFIGDSDLLYTVDLICHGTPPQTYFEEHFDARKREIVSVNFRDGKYYKLKMQDIKGKFYNINGGVDEYYLSFIYGISFSDCCYRCKFANINRNADITIGDFLGIDESVKKNYKIDRISVLLINTERGEKFLSSISEIRLIERDIKEAIKRNEQLQHPFLISEDRKKFELLYPILGFDKTIHKLRLEKIRRKNLFLEKLSRIKRLMLRK